MLNRAILVGRLTRDPEVRKTGSGLAVASFTIACDDSYKGPNGEKNTLFMNVSVFGPRGENVAKFTRKGSLVAVQGRLNQRKYTGKDNVQRTVIELIADGVDFLDPKGSNPASDSFGTPAASTATREPASESGNLDSIDVVDDDLPF